MPKTITRPVPTDMAIAQINSLGGPPLPTGMSAPTLQVILENRSAAQVAQAGYRIANALIIRQQT